MRHLSALLCRAMLLATAGVVAAQAAWLATIFPALLWLGLLGGAWRITRPRFPLSDAFGSAAFADWADLDRARLLGDTGLILGRVGLMPKPTRLHALAALIDPSVSSERACADAFSAFLGARRDGFIRVNDFVHLLTVSPAGGGKTVHSLGPTLLSHDGNCVVVDPKGELFRLSAAHRKRHFGHEIVRLDPARLYDERCGPGHRLNPLDWIDPASPRFVDACRDLANMLVVRTGQEHEPYWSDSSENIIAAFCAFICACEGNPAARNLRGMRTYLASRPMYAKALEIMQQKEGFQGVLQQFGHSMSWHVDRELGSVMAHTQRNTSLFDSPLVAAATQRTTFDPSRLRTGKMTVYIILPSDLLVVWAALQRLWLGTLLRLVTRGTPTEKCPVIFLIDEAAHIGRMQVLVDAVTLMRGMGVRCWFFFQSLEQLTKCFGDDASTVLDNLATQQYFAINSYETAEMLSKRLGDATIVSRSENENTGWSVSSGSGQQQQSGSQSGGRGSTTSEHGRALLRPDECLRLSERAALVFHKNGRPILAERIRYYADPAFRRARHGYGAGRPRGVGRGGMMLAAFLLLLALLLAGFSQWLPASGRQPTDAQVPFEAAPIDYAPVPEINDLPVYRPDSPVHRRRGNRSLIQIR